MPHQSQPVDETLYREDDFTFVKEECGIYDPDALKKHILAVQAKAYALHCFPCISMFSFAKTQMSTLPAYNEVLKLGREREGAILLDLGCCCGTDIRKVARDGFPVGNLLASDILADFWDTGHELFRSTPKTFPVVFLPGDALDPEFLEPSAPLAAPMRVPDGGSPPPLTSLTCLTPLRGRVSVIHISAVLHLFSEDHQLHAVRSLAGLLSPLPGSIILGWHLGRRVKGFGLLGHASLDGRHVFCHSPDSWRALWEGVFPQGTIKVEVELAEIASDDGEDWGRMTWSVVKI
ncbi:hypothetical protein C8F04DRAFT_1142489 [Mycena alexandri]|uniref:Methyltransferase domain-containing protein n=1 Tax=Mycena alexandri TaxID=1745969 RepID=A0AAD6S470_9AGAR|nr:hypothetical protein C8F04DRAFT_1142489 [Mycena alexandri]